MGGFPTSGGATGDDLAALIANQTAVTPSANNMRTRVTLSGHEIH